MDPYRNFIESQILTIMGKAAKKLIRDDARLREDIGMTSLNTVLLMSGIVEEFKIDMAGVDSEELLQVSTVADITQLTRKYAPQPQ